MKLEFELGDNGKVTASASNCPKQVGVLIFAASDPLAVYLDRDQIVDSHATLACQPTRPPA